MSESVGHYMRELAKQGKGEGRLVMYDEHGEPVAALVLFRNEVSERLQHLEKFNEQATNHFSTMLQ